MQAALARLARELGLNHLPSALEALDYAWAEILTAADGGFGRKLEKAKELLQELKELRKTEERRGARRAHSQARRTLRRTARRAAAAARVRTADPADAHEGFVAKAAEAAAGVEASDAEVGPARAGAAPRTAAELHSAEVGPARAGAEVDATADGASSPTGERPAGVPAPRRVAERSPAAGLPRPPFAYPAPASDGAEVLQDHEVPYEEDLSVPWETVSATSVPCPGADGLLLMVPVRVPFWESQEPAPFPGPGHACPGAAEASANPCRHDQANRAARRAAAIDRGARTRRGSAETRRTVLRRDRFRCLCPDCPNSIWIHLHHLTLYCLGGPSLPENEIALCSRCHRNAHKGRLVIRGTLAEGLEWFDSSRRRLGDAAEEVQRRSRDYAEEILAFAGV